MRHRWIGLTVATLTLTACTPPEPGSISRPTPTITRVSFLPALADYAALSAGSWLVEQRFGPGYATVPPEQRAHSSNVEPTGCADVPYRRPEAVIAETIGKATNPGPTGFGAEASVRILRAPAGTDLLEATRVWAKHCQDYREVALDGSYTAPTAISVLPSTAIDGVELLRLHLTDNRAERFQPEGSRVSVVYLARVRDEVVYGFGHDDGDVAAGLVGLTIRRLRDGTVATPPRATTVQAAGLAGRSDVEFATLLPTVAELPAEWRTAEAFPMAGLRSEDYPDKSDTEPSGCDRLPFINLSGPRTDLKRHFQTLVAGGASRRSERGYLIDPFGQFSGDTDVHTLMLGVEAGGGDVIAATRGWAATCARYQSSATTRWPMHGTVEVLPVAAPPGVDDIVSVRLTEDGPNKRDITASVLRVRGVLVVTLPAVDRQDGPLLGQTLDNLRTATFSGASSARPPAPDYDAPPPGLAALPAPSTAATEQLSRVSSGTPVDSTPYHLGGYMPGDAKVRSPDTLYFHSPTGSINCAFHQHYGGLTCDIPEGNYPRTPAPTGLPGSWFDHYVHFDDRTIENGVSAYLPRVAAESNELPYGSTIRLSSMSPYGDTACLMATDGLTCVNYHSRVGLHLSRDDLTPLVATEALTAHPS